MRSRLVQARQSGSVGELEFAIPDSCLKTYLQSLEFSRCLHGDDFYVSRSQVHLCIMLSHLVFLILFCNEIRLQQAFSEGSQNKGKQQGTISHIELVDYFNDYKCNYFVDIDLAVARLPDSSHTIDCCFYVKNVN